MTEMMYLSPLFFLESVLPLQYTTHYQAFELCKKCWQSLDHSSPLKMVKRRGNLDILISQLCLKVLGGGIYEFDKDKKLTRLHGVE